MTTRTARQCRIDRHLIRALMDAGDYGLTQATLVEEIKLRMIPPPSQAEAEEAINHADTQGRINGVMTESGMHHKLTLNGQHWASENRV